MSILERLSGVRKTGADQYVAKCPAHDDRSPSLSIRECDDGRTLLHCFGGCEVEEVLAALGLTFGDLYPEPISNHVKPFRRRFNANTVLQACHHELLVASIILSRVPELSDRDVERLTLATGRLGKAVSAANG